MKKTHPFFEYAFQPIVHRGLSDNFSENTLESFKETTSLGYKYLETDLRLTSDNYVVAFHDDNLKRVANFDKKINDISFKEIKNINLINGGTILDLGSLLEEFPRTKFNIDVKDFNTLIPTIEILDSLNVYDRVCVASFNSFILWRLKKMRPQSCVSMGVLDTFLFKLFNILINEIDCIQVPLKWRGLKVFNNKLVKKAHLHNFKIHVWTINDEEEMVKLINENIDGIISDDAVLLKSVSERFNLFDFENRKK